MGILDDIKKAIGLGQAKKIEAPKPKKPNKSAKDIATKKGEPYIEVISLDLDPNNPGNGAFELDWNDEFLKRLWKAGYKDENEHDVIDRWFQDVCRNIVLETYEKEQAMVTRNEPNDLGDGRTEYK